MSHGAALLVTLDRSLAEHAMHLRNRGIRCQVIASCDQLSAALNSGEAISPRSTVAIVDGELPPRMLEGTFATLQGPEPIPALTLAPLTNSAVASEFHRPGYDEYALRPRSSQELALRIEALRIHTGRATEAITPVSSLAGPQASRTGRIVVVFAPKGGIGKSTMSVNLAVGLARFHGLKALLADADLEFGDVGVLLNTVSRRSIFDVAMDPEITPNAVERAIASHASGIQMLLRPGDFSVSERIPPDGVARTLEICRGLFDVVIVDTGPDLQELNLQLFDLADQILLLAAPEVSSVHHLRRFIDVSKYIGIEEKLFLVLNRADSGMRRPVIEELLGLPICGAVVSDGRTVVEAANQGVSLFDLDPHQEAEVTRSMATVVEAVLNQIRPALDGATHTHPPLLGEPGMLAPQSDAA